MTLIIITYLAGVLTILSPCILPVLPFVFSKSQGSFLKNGVPLLIGMAITFSVFSGIAIIGGEWLGRANEIGRIVAMVLLTFFGLSLIFPHISEMALAPIINLGNKIGNRPKSDNIGGSILIGVSTGLLWAPCAGPILGLVLTGAAAQGHAASSVGLLLSYSLGAITSLAVALLAGKQFFNTLKKFLVADRVIRLGLGIAVLLGVAAIAFNLDRTLLTRISKVGTESIETKLLALTTQPSSETAAIVEGPLPELDGAVSWLNSKPLTIADLKGHVVLIDFWTYSCINCLRTLPYVKTWAEKYKDDGLIVIGVHTPEFAFEKSRDNVEKAVKDLGVTYPVAIDSDYKIWNAFHNRYWPAHYFVDRSGKIRHHHFGEGQYAESEEMLRKLLTENGSSLQTRSAAMPASGAQASSDLSDVRSPETYIGYDKAENFVGDQEIQGDEISLYKAPTTLKLNAWSLNGKWLIEDERAIAKSAGAKVVYRFHARDLHLVLGSGDKSIQFHVTIDGKAPLASHGADIDENGNGTINSHRLYQLIRQSGDEKSKDHTFEIEFSSPGAEVYAFTFG